MHHRRQASSPAGWTPRSVWFLVEAELGRSPGDSRISSKRDSNDWGGTAERPEGKFLSVCRAAVFLKCFVAPEHHPSPNSSQPQKIPMLGLPRRRRERLCFLLYHRYGFDLYHAVLRNYMLSAHLAREMVIGPVSLGLLMERIWSPLLSFRRYWCAQPQRKA